MESHPVPQNVTAFEFHLIGNMTMRQFGYLAIGVIIAYVSFLLFFEAAPLLAWPLMIIPSLVGAAYAFLPIMERPLDYWTKAFIKAIRRPTMRKYNSKTIFAEDPKFKDRLDIYLHFLQTIPKNKMDISNQLKTNTPISTIEEPAPALAPQALTPAVPAAQPDPNQPPAEPKAPSHDQIGEFINNLNKLASPTVDSNKSVSEPTITPTTPVDTTAQLQPETQPQSQAQNPTFPSTPPVFTPPPPPPAFQSQDPNIATDQNPLLPPKNEPNPSADDLEKTVALAKQAQLIQNRIMEAEKQINDIKSGAATQSMDPKRYTEQFQAVLSDLQKLNQRARDISHELAELSKTPAVPMSAQPVEKPNIIPSLTLTSTANIINGIVTDTQGNYIEGAIIVAHDKAGLPVRALKTNKLGQFIAATPLPSGTYTISVEKDDLGFDVIQIELEDKILNPIVISAKKGATPS